MAVLPHCWGVLTLPPCGRHAADVVLQGVMGKVAPIIQLYRPRTCSVQQVACTQSVKQEPVQHSGRVVVYLMTLRARHHGRPGVRAPVCCWSLAPVERMPGGDRHSNGLLV